MSTTKLCHDSMMAMLDGKLERGARTSRWLPGNSALNRLALSALALTRYTAHAPPSLVATHSVLRYWGSMLANFTRLA